MTDQIPAEALIAEAREVLVKWNRDRDWMPRSPLGVIERLADALEAALSAHPAEETEYERGWRDGWFSSGEGFNGEWPDEGKTWEKSAGYQEFRRQNPLPEGSET